MIDQPEAGAKTVAIVPHSSLFSSYMGSQRFDF